QRPGADSHQEPLPDRNRKLSGRGDREEVRARKAQGIRFGTVEAGLVDLDGLALPGRTVDHALAVRGKAPRREVAAAEGQALERRNRRSRRTPEEPTGGEPHGECGREA